MDATLIQLQGKWNALLLRHSRLQELANRLEADLRAWYSQEWDDTEEPDTEGGKKTRDLLHKAKLMREGAGHVRGF